MANYLNLTTRSADYNSARLPKLQGQIRPTITVVDTDTHLYDYDSGTYVFLEVDSATQVKIFLPKPRKGLYFTFLLTKENTKTGHIKIGPADGVMTVRTDVPAVNINKPVYTITLDADFITGNTLNGKVDSDALDALPFDSAHATTITNLANALALSTKINTAVVDGRVVTVTGQTAGTNVELSSFALTGGVSQAGITVVQTVKAVEAASATALVNTSVTEIEILNEAREGLAVEIISTHNKWHANFYAASALDIGLVL